MIHFTFVPSVCCLRGVGGEWISGAEVKKDEGIVVCRLPVLLSIVADLALQSSWYVAGRYIILRLSTS